MGKKFYKNWLVSFIVLFLVDFLWHGLIFAAFYAKQLADIGRFSGGKLAALVPFLAIGDILVALGYSYFVPAASAVTKRYVVNGLVAGIVITGSFAIFNHAILAGWANAIMGADLAYGVVAGLILGTLQKFLNREPKTA